MKNTFKSLYIDQYGKKYYAATVKDLKAQIGKSKAFPMYQDVNGKTYKTGYVIGNQWLTKYEASIKEA